MKLKIRIPDLQANGCMVIFMDLEFILEKMAMSILETGWIVKNRDKVECNGSVDVFTQVAGKMI